MHAEFVPFPEWRYYVSVYIGPAAACLLAGSLMPRQALFVSPAEI